VADKLGLKVVLSFVETNYRISIKNSSKYDLTETASFRNSEDVNNTPSQMELGPVASADGCDFLIHNIGDSTVLINLDSTNDRLKLDAGEITVFQIKNNVIPEVSCAGVETSRIDYIVTR